MTAPRLTPQQTAIFRMLSAAGGTLVSVRYLAAGAQTTSYTAGVQIRHMRRAGVAIERREQSFRLVAA